MPWALQSSPSALAEFVGGRNGKGGWKRLWERERKERKEGRGIKEMEKGGDYNVTPIANISNRISGEVTV